jgi:hypothetical protein
MPPWSQGAGSCPAREGEVGGFDAIEATGGRGKAKLFPFAFLSRLISEAATLLSNAGHTGELDNRLSWCGFGLLFDQHNAARHFSDEPISATTKKKMLHPTFFM